MFDVIMPSSLADRRQFPVETVEAGSATVLCQRRYTDGGTVQDGTAVQDGALREGTVCNQ